MGLTKRHNTTSQCTPWHKIKKGKVYDVHTSIARIVTTLVPTLSFACKKCCSHKSRFQETVLGEQRLTLISFQSPSHSSYMPYRHILESVLEVWKRHSTRHAVSLTATAQYAFKGSMIHWVVQFALRIAFRSVLHRYTSLEIHRWKSSLSSIIPCDKY